MVLIVILFRFDFDGICFCILVLDYEDRNILIFDSQREAYVVIFDV